ncbi:MAG: ABC transporter permease [Lachnospiraceae bacterium]|nr:ABC transporter permease [Lachnospiraceae bacterium]
MFWHNLKYEIKTVMREKDFILWMMLFPIILGTLFKVAFGSIYENAETFHTIPVAVVETKENEVFAGMLTAMTEGEEPALSATVTDDGEARKLLFDGDVYGILYVGDTVELSVTGKGMQQTILQEIVARCSVYETVIRDAIAENPAAVSDAVKALSAEVDVCRKNASEAGNPDVYVQYFYNLIAMVAICGCMTGLHVSTNSQANQSTLGARRNCSATPKSIHLVTGVLGSAVSQTCSMVVCVTFLRFVLRVNFGGSLILLYLSAILSGFLGVTMGFFVGSIGRMRYEVKEAISMSVSMVLCFLSGLMVGNMKGIIAEHMPWINRVNPVAIMSDSFYCLNMYSDYRRFMTKIVGMLIYIVAFTVIGVLFARRKKYASI